MKTPKVERRPMTLEAVREVLGEDPPFRMKGEAVYVDDELVGIVGSYIDQAGKMFLFSSQVRPDVLPKKYRVLIARDLVSSVRKKGIPVHALCRTERDTRFLERFGFTYDRKTDFGNLLMWSL